MLIFFFEILRHKDINAGNFELSVKVADFSFSSQNTIQNAYIR